MPYFWYNMKASGGCDCTRATEVSIDVASSMPTYISVVWGRVNLP